MSEINSNHNKNNLSNEDISYIQQLGRQAKKASLSLRGIHTSQKNEALLFLAELLNKERVRIKDINNIDIEAAESNGLSQAMIDRLVLNDKVIDSIIQSLKEIVMLKDPVGEIIDGWSLENGVRISKERIPIGVVSIIYESRPNVTIDVGALGLKSSNAVILRGGKEAINSNKILANLFQKALKQAKISANAIQLVEKPSRDLMKALLKADEYIDLIVPRGGSGLIRFVSENSIIPVVKHDKGLCHLYVHESANLEKSLPVILNSKVQRPGVCNAAETILIDRAYPQKIEILKALQNENVILHADTKTKAEIEEMTDVPIEVLSEEGYDKEYLSLDISVKIVDNIEQAISHIQKHTSYHSEAILSEDYSSIQKFQQELDSAAIFVNCSTRFHDGGQFGLGAEVGISTGKLHARGPMGLSDLTTYKFIVTGEGQIRK